MPSRTASCSCGQLRIEVQGEPLGVGVCHCLACQRRTGSVFAALASFAAPYEVFGTATEFDQLRMHFGLSMLFVAGGTDLPSLGFSGYCHTMQTSVILDRRQADSSEDRGLNWGAERR